MLYCPGVDCPLRTDCYRFTQPSPNRDRFAALPYEAATGTCAEFVSNIPSEALIRETAYYLWLHCDRPQHQADAHWQEAYQQLCRSTGRLC
jgi:hypothetical protein